ncbi:MAG: cytochrome c [Myxococcota bacterium]|jgi:mono/diheme cytochrome c family protein|nr:cytochrome c [Myxococcota bacterium]
MPDKQNGRGLPVIAQVALVFAGAYLLLRFSVQPPIPSSVLGMYMFFVGVSLMLFVSSDDDRFAEFKRPLIQLLTAREHKVPRLVLGTVFPLLVAYLGYAGAHTEIAPPGQQRTVHPAPPNEIDFKGKRIDVLTAENPFRHLAEEEPEAFREHVARGKDVYYRNCVFCHGDNLEGDGLYAHGLSPIPANLADPGTIAQLQESYLFWRIAKGGPGLPVEGTPWDSAMPAWEKFLDEDEIWEVILFLYDFTDQHPRSWEE